MATLKVKDLNLNLLFNKFKTNFSPLLDAGLTLNPFNNFENLALSYSNRSGYKLASLMTKRTINTIADENEAYNKISNAIIDLFGDNWKRIIKDNLVDYDPAYDTNRNEVETIESSQTSQSSQSDNGNSKDFTRGFNSTSDVPAGSNQVESTSNGSSSGSGNSRRELNIKANSALKTQAEVLEIDANFWNNFNMYEIIFNDIDKELTLELYDEDDLERMEGEIYG